jgi:hypothetical protein
MITIIPARQQPSAAHQPTNHVRHNRTIQIGHVHHVKLPGVRHQLHATIVDDHVVVLNVRVLFGNLARHVQEQTVRQLHDVGLVDGGHLLATMRFGILEGEACNTLGILGGHDFHALHHSLDTLMLQHGVLALRVLAHNHDIDVVVTGGHTGVRLAVQHVDEQVEFVAQSYVSGDDANLLGLGLNVTLDGHTVTLDGRDGVLQVIVALAGRVDVDLFKVNWHASESEDFAQVTHQFWPNATAWQHCHRVSATVLRHRHDGLQRKSRRLSSSH